MVHVEALLGVKCLLNCVMFCMYSISHINLIDVGLQKKKVVSGSKTHHAEFGKAKHK